MSKRVRAVKFAFLVLFSVWTLFLLSFLAYYIYASYGYAEKLALNEAEVSTKKDLAYRSWVASHGGVYVPITQRTPSSPYLSHVQNRDVNTTDGQNLTLMNPAYTLSQMMKEYAELYGTKGHITSLKLLNPNNKPDSWEEAALKKLESTKEPFYEKREIEAREHLSYIKPLFVENECLKCHAFQGYKIGEVRGGVSVDIPLDVYYKEAYSKCIPVVFYFIALWLIGSFFIYLAYSKAEAFIQDKIKNYEQYIYNLVNIIEQRDRYTAGHTQRVAHYSVLIAKELGIKEKDVELLRRACMLHDIGKISIPDAILLKPDRLSNLEYAIIKEHVTTGYELLRKIDIYAEIAEIIRYHHEHYDGSGYPQGLKGDDIPFLSQIMTVADAFDAMTTNRVYKKYKSVEVALKEIESLSSKQFHPLVSEAALKALKDLDIGEYDCQLPKSRLEEERFAYFYKDQVTDLQNRNYLNLVLNQKQQYRYIYGLFLNNFTQYNKIYGWKGGDELLRECAIEIQKMLPQGAIIFRMFGDDFMFMCNDDSIRVEHFKSLSELLKPTKVGFVLKCIDLEAMPFENADLIEQTFKEMPEC